MLAHRLGELLDRHRRVAIEPGVAAGVRFARSGDQFVGVAELGQEAVDRRLAVHATSSLTSASGTSVRISKIEIIGNRRTNRNNNDTKSPIVPMNVDQSQNVG